MCSTVSAKTEIYTVSAKTEIRKSKCRGFDLCSNHYTTTTISELIVQGIVDGNKTRFNYLQPWVLLSFQRFNLSNLAIVPASDGKKHVLHELEMSAIQSQCLKYLSYSQMDVEYLCSHALRCQSYYMKN